MTPDARQQVDISFATPLQVALRVTLVAEPSGTTHRAVFSFEFDNLSFRGENMSATMQAYTYATLSVQWNDKNGAPVKVDGPTTWASSDPSTLQVTVATGNPQIANLYAPGPVGKAQIQATADADLGEGVKTVTSTIEVEVIAGEAVGGEITFSQGVSQGGTPAQAAAAPAKQ